MNHWILILMTMLFALAGCGSSKNKRPLMVEIHDESLENDVCAAVYLYAQTVLELGRGSSRGQFRINGHLWRSFSPLISADSTVVAEFSPNDYATREDIVKLIKGVDSESLFFSIRLDGQEPAEKLFLLMDFVEDAGLRCWINPTEEMVKSSASPLSGL